MALGYCPCIDVHTTTEFGRVRIMDRSCSEIGTPSSKRVGWEGGRSSGELCRALVSVQIR